METSKMFVFDKYSKYPIDDCNIKIDYNKTLTYETPRECGILDVILPELSMSLIEGNFKIELYFVCRQNLKPKNLAYTESHFERVFHYDLKKNYIDMNDMIKDIDNITSSVKPTLFNIMKREWSSFDESDPQNLNEDAIFKLSQDENSLKLSIRIGFIKVKSTYKDHNKEGKLVDITHYPKQAWYFFRFNKDLMSEIVDKKIQTQLADLYSHAEIRHDEPIPGFVPLGPGLITKTFNQENFILSKSKHRTKPDILIVYTDIITKSYINDKKANILARFKYDEKSEVKLNDKIIYLPLRVQEFNSITVDIRDILGRKVYFTSGVLSITLIIRSIKY